jgi:predicted amidohydrolase
MKLAIYQGPSLEGDVDAALKVIERTLLCVSLGGAHMVVFPELFLPGYNQADLHKTMAQTKNGLWDEILSGFALKYRCGITIGWAEREGGNIFNSVSCFDDQGEKIGHYRKIQLFGPIEKETFQVGSSYSTFELNGYKAAVLICYDVEFSHHVSALKELNVDLLLVPTANPLKFNNVPDILVPARALENGMTIAYANFSGTERGLKYGGSSVIVGPDGQPLAKAGCGQAILIADLTAVSEIDKSLLSTQKQDIRWVN